MERKRLVFKNTPWGDKILNPAVMENWNYDGWLSVLTAEGCKPEPDPFHPTFIRAKIISGYMDEVVQEIYTGPKENFQSYFATAETAAEIARRFDGAVVEMNNHYEGGIKTDPPTAFGIKFKSGKILNAGVLASYYMRMPEDEFSGAAAKAVQLLIDAKE